MELRGRAGVAALSFRQREWSEEEGAEWGEGWDFRLSCSGGGRELLEVSTAGGDRVLFP